MYKKALLLGVGALALSAGSYAAPLANTDIIANWTAQDDPVTGVNNGLWNVSGTSVSNGGNRTGALISDFSSTGDFSFSSTITPVGDDDLFSLAFGWQDSDNTYLLGWGGGGVSSWGNWNGIQLSRFDSGVATDLVSQATNWSAGTYTLEVGRSGQNIFASITQGVNTIFSASVVDTTYMTGNVGFQTWSQFAQFDQNDFTDSSGQVSIPSVMALFTLGLVGMGAARRKRAL